MEENREIVKMTKSQRRTSMRGATLASVFNVAGLTLISPQVMILLAIKAGAGDIFVGLLSFFIMAPFVLCLFALPQMERIGKRRVILFWECVKVAVILPFIFLPQIAQAYPLYVFMASLLFVQLLRSTAGSMAFAAWFPWLQDIVPNRVTGRFFGNIRTAWQTSGLIVMVMAAWFLGDQPHWWKFNLIFAIAVIFMLINVFYVRQVSDNPEVPIQRRKISVLTIIKTFVKSKEERKILAYLIAYAMAFGMCIPFQIKYLKDLGYGEGFILAACSMVNVGAILTLRSWGKLADKFGNVVIFSISHMGMIIVTALWIVIGKDRLSIILLFALFLFNSVFNSGNGIAQTRYIMHSIPIERQNHITILNMLTIVTWGIAPLIGMAILLLTDDIAIDLAGRTFNNYHLLFLINAALFLIPHALRKHLKADKETPTVEVLALMLRPFTVMRFPFVRFIKK